MYELKKISISRLYLTSIVINLSLIPFVYWLHGTKHKVDNDDYLSAINCGATIDDFVFRLYHPFLISFILIFVIPYLSLLLLTDWSKKYAFLLKAILNYDPLFYPPLEILPFHFLANSLSGLLIYIIVFNVKEFSLLYFSIYVAMLPSLIVGLNFLAILLFQYLLTMFR